MELKNNIFVTVAIIIVFVIFILTSTVVLELFVSRVTGPDIVKINSTVESTQKNTSESTEIKIQNTNKYANSEFGITFNYPKNLEVLDESIDQFNKDFLNIAFVERSASSSKKEFTEMTPGDSLVFSRILTVYYLRNGNDKNLDPDEYIKKQGWQYNSKINPGIGGFATFFTLQNAPSNTEPKIMALYTVFKGKDVVGISLDDRTGIDSSVVVEIISSIAASVKFTK